MPDIFVSPTSDKTVSSPSVSGKINKKKSSSQKFNLHKHFFSAYLFMPDGVRFETQEPGESIILLLRRHWITNIVWVGIGILLVILPIFILPIITILGVIPPNLPTSYFSLLIFIWYLLTFSYILVNFLLWYFTVSIVTNERIIDIDFINILNKKFAETRIGRIEDVTNRTGGFISAVFDFGDVIVQTAAKEAMFQFGSVPHPEQVVKIINELMVKEGKGE